MVYVFVPAYPPAACAAAIRNVAPTVALENDPPAGSATPAAGISPPKVKVSTVMVAVVQVVGVVQVMVTEALPTLGLTVAAAWPATVKIAVAVAVLAEADVAIDPKFSGVVFVIVNAAITVAVMLKVDVVLPEAATACAA